MKPPENSLLVKLKSKVSLSKVNSAYIEEELRSSDDSAKAEDNSLTSRSITSDEDDHANWID